MSTPNAVNVSHALANSLMSLGTQTEEEKLFQEAIQNVIAKKQKAGSISTFLRDLNSARTVKDVSKAFERERAANKLWQEENGSKWKKRVSDLAARVMSYKDLGDTLVQINSRIAGPIWGAIKFILGVIQEFSKTEELLNSAKERLKVTMEMFGEIYKPGETIQGSLRSNLLKYYELVITFVVDLQSKFAQSTAVLALDVIHKAVKDVTDAFLQKLTHIYQDVNASANSKRHDKHENYAIEVLGRLDDLQARVARGSSINPVAAPGTRAGAYGIPRLLSKSFTGQRQYLYSIWSSLNTLGIGQAQATVYGIGGIGKTQILLKYANDHHPGLNLPTSYHTIIWINAASPPDVDRTVRSFLSQNPIGGGNYQPHDHFASFQQWLRNSDKWLLILDNVEELSTVSSILPDGDHGHVLCSTRHRLLASQLCHNTEPIEIRQMEEQDALQLAESLAQQSKLDVDKTTPVAAQVARFAKGLPLMIEQIIHDAIFSGRSIENTLDMIHDKERLLSQQNLSSLRGFDSSVGAIVLQAKQVLQERSLQAAALLEVLVYWEASSIPLEMITLGAKKLHEYVDRKYTYDRGHVERSSNSLFWSHERIDTSNQGTEAKSDVQARSRPRGFRSVLKLGRERSKSPLQDLPIDSTKHDDALRKACRDDTPSGQLFRDKVNIEDAVKLLEDLALVRRIDNKHLWIHDVFTKVLQALIQNANMAEAERAAVTSATLVYLAFPIPTNMDSYRRLESCWEYLPHAIACHGHLLSFGILNDLSLGPELSHVIASTISRKSNLDEPLIDSEIVGAERGQTYAQRERERNNEIIKYYKYAVAGYLASAARLDAMEGVSEARVIASILADEKREASHGFNHTHYYMDCQRFGRSAHWRVLQTSFRLSQYYEDNGGDDLAEAIAHTRLCLAIHQRIFGMSHDHLLYIRQMLYAQLTAAGRHEDAYQIAVEGIRNFLVYNKIERMKLGPDEHGELTYSRTAGLCCENAGKSCLELPDRLHEAPLFFYVWLRRAEMSGGKEHYSCRQPMQALATAYEKLGERSTSVYWWGRSVLCVLSVLEWEPMMSDPDHAYDPGPWIGAFLNCEETMQETVRDYEQTRVRLGEFQDLELQKFLDTVNIRISVWRGDRERHGSPYERPDEEFTGELPEWVKKRLEKWS